MLIGKLPMTTKSSSLPRIPLGLPVASVPTAVTGSAWLLVVGYAGHGLKDFWQERYHYVANTRWWPPFCAAVDWLLAVILVIEIAAGVNFHH